MPIETSAVALATAEPITKIIIRRPDEWHVHFRDNNMMRAVLPYTAEVFGRAIVMPNLVPPVVSVEDAVAYRDRILAALPRRGKSFTPLMTCYLTDGASADEIIWGYEEKIFAAVKLYPAHATTNSAHGVTNIEKVMPILERMAEVGMPLLIHGEELHVDGEEVDIFDRELFFIEHVLMPLRDRLPELKIVLEHITNEEAVQYVLGQYPFPRRPDDALVSDSISPKISATITPHHLVINRNHIFQGGIRPHLYCLPIAKREKHRKALRKAATSGLPCFFLGTDSAPHAVDTKEAACGCAGIFCAPTALATYAEVFEEEGALDKFEAFASLNGPKFYGLKPNEELLTLVRGEWQAPHRISLPGRDISDPTASVAVFRGGETLRWKIAA